MTLTLLLDLDDTLLATHMEQFIPAYFQALANHLAPHVAPEVMLPALAAGTRAMLAHRDAARTLRQVFDAEFYSQVGLAPDALQPVIEEFYDEVFPSLEMTTAPMPGAVELVERAFELGYRVAIATDPIFPLKATQHRLRFARLPPEKYPFALISAYEKFHFTKTYPEYYAEFLGQLGWPDGPVLMVGNDAERDIAPARALGLATFWIRTVQAAAAPQPDSLQGSLSDLRVWLESAELKTLEPIFQTKESAVALLAAAAASIAVNMQAVPEASWSWRRGQSDWALTEVLCHLRDTELEVNLPRLERVLSEDSPFMPAPDTKAWAAQRGYLEQDAAGAWRDFVIAREILLARLREISAEDWERRARHSIFGPTSLHEVVGFIAQHDRLHIQQIWEIAQRAQQKLILRTN